MPLCQSNNFFMKNIDRIASSELSRRCLSFFNEMFQALKAFTDSWLNLLLVTIIGSIICFLPLMANLKDDDSLKNIYHAILAMKSIEFRYSVVANIATCLPMAIDLISDLISCIRSSENNAFKLNTYLPRIVLILSMILPDILMLLVALPFEHLKLFICLFYSRYILIFYGIFGYLWVNDNSSSMKIQWSHICFNIALICATWNVMSSPPEGHIYYIFVTFLILAIILFLYYLYNWLERIKHVQFYSLSILQITCGGYLVAFSFLIVISSCLLLRGVFDTLFVTLQTYAICIFSLTLTSLKFGILKLEINVKENALELKRTFVRFVSHEIRTPLNAVSMGLELLQREIKLLDIPGDIEETVMEIQGACGVSLDILNDLLSYEKLEAGIMVLETSQVQAWRLIIDALRPFFMQARRSEITLNTPRRGCGEYAMLRSTYLEADKNRLTQVIRNLVSNALKFTPRGGHVSISTELITDMIRANDGSNGVVKKLLRIEVCDSGAGISAENLPKIFNEIVQINPGKLQGGGGSGFGLYLCKSIVDLHKGRMFVSSQGEERGSTFTLDVPLADDSVQDEVRRSTDPSMRTSLSDFVPLSVSVRRFPSRPSGQALDDSVHSCEVDTSTSTVPPVRLGEPVSISSIPLRQNLFSPRPASDGNLVQHFRSAIIEDDKKINRATRASSYSGRDKKKGLLLNTLVADDAASNRKLLCRLIKHRCDVVEADDGDTAATLVIKSMATAGRFDVVLMDFQMPRMNGPEAVKRIRAAGYDGVIIGITGNALQVDIDYFLAHGADKVLPKPVDIKKLEEVLDDMTYFI